MKKLGLICLSLLFVFLISCDIVTDPNDIGDSSYNSEFLGYVSGFFLSTGGTFSSDGKTYTDDGQTYTFVIAYNATAGIYERGGSNYKITVEKYNTTGGTILVELI